ncbi:LLM class flavin-dependent oxidoreductase [Mycobacteroides abscessus]|uniref:LLM class flavin-dependent oxidoreductase n=1 Tax=Mycobacteroides abscessus TaxID=36809 RepID=UPI00092C4787|nr:LLM class flavin-dependent oxidoreductase [Mycobacteroides abscessus]NOS00044.1 LLM class flavin-dependent oxidoreductase [Mycobacteroides abscessus]SIL63268.1 putative F420-dependent oxidoreductase, MSMEG_4141 family [Mycobacteroides abscessus subsp. abscessus]SLC97772.1 putative F420-dependent oxidoreductase, MSMEG_4141 family [Mycobacteroides abscessus subsp. abscessus]
MSDVVAAARRALGAVGAFLPMHFTSMPSVGEQRAAVVRMEAAGYRTTWLNEPVGGKDVLVQAGLLLAATEHMTFATGIANIWARPAVTAHGGAAMLAQAYPDRFVLGLGAGYPSQAELVGSHFGSGLGAMRDYLSRMGESTPLPAVDVRYPRIVAANGPKMLALARDAADGAMPAGRPPAFTAQVRQALGRDKLIVVGVDVIVAGDGDDTKTIARNMVSMRLELPGVRGGLKSLGYADEEVADISDRLVDDLVAYGSPGDVATMVDRHLQAGADHVVLVPANVETEVGVRYLEQLAPALLS